MNSFEYFDYGLIAFFYSNTYEACVRKEDDPYEVFEAQQIPFFIQMLNLRAKISIILNVFAYFIFSEREYVRIL